MKKVERISVHTISSSASNAISVGRFIIDSIPGVNFIAEIIVRGQAPDHDAINVKIKGSKCKETCRYTIEYKEGGKNSCLTDLFTISDNNSSDWTKEKYSLLYHNCKDFVEEKYNEIVSKYCKN